MYGLTSKFDCSISLANFESDVKEEPCAFGTLSMYGNLD